MGEDLGDLSIEDLRGLEQKMDASLGLVRERKVGLWNISLIGFRLVWGQKYFDWFDGSVKNLGFLKISMPFSFLAIVMILFSRKTEGFKNLAKQKNKK